MRLESNYVEETKAIGATIGGLLMPGDAVGLIGPLGAGKTQMVKGLGRGLGVPDDRIVNSPTFVLHNEYRGRFAVHHLDAYRLSGAAELTAVGFEELFEDGVVLLEWADRASEMIPAEGLWAELSIIGPSRRVLEVWTNSERLARALAGADLDRWRRGGHK